ncbi:hypothetical protein HD554DRAFT_2169014 [Boletus coccyginus]|nr:hypothetical protein HD554DRAFT_2169014 [Boletus coccyginus]
MPELDECNQLLVTNPFADDSSAVSPSNTHDTLLTLTHKSSSEHHPLCSRPVSPACRCNTRSIPTVTVVGSEGETPPRLTRVLSLDGVAADSEESRTTGSLSEASRGGSDVIIHPVGPNDSLAGVALRYDVSIAALRRANQMWPSDPIHLRTELLIPRGDALRAWQKPTRSPSTDTTLRSTVEPTLGFPPDFVPSSFVAARNIILSMLPARISLDSLSSKASMSEDHELDDLRTVRAHKISATEAPFAEAGHELSILAAPQAQYRLPSVAPSSQVPRSSINHPRLRLNHISSVGNLHSRSISSSPTVSLRPPRAQPFAVLPVRTSQLEPQPAMELPVRRPRI